MSSGTLYDKVWDRHKVAELPDGRDQLFIGLHLMHEVTSPQAFGMLRERDIDVAFPERTLATEATDARPDGVDWDALDAEKLSEIPVLAERAPERG